MVTAIEDAVMEADGKQGLTVSGDGAWFTRRFSSLHGMATLCSTAERPKVVGTSWYCGKYTTSRSGRC